MTSPQLVLVEQKMSGPSLPQSGSEEPISHPGSQAPGRRPIPPKAETPVDSGQPGPDTGVSSRWKLQPPPDSDRGSGEEDKPVEGEERSAKNKPEYGHRFSLYSTLSKMRGAKKEKPPLADPAAPLSPSRAVGDRLPPGLLPRLQAERSVLGRKVPRLSEQLRVRQSERRDNAALYLRLVAAADAARAPRIQRAFEHKDRHLRSAVSRLQARLEHCVRRQAELDRHIALLQAQALGPTLEDQSQALGPTSEDQARTLALGPTQEDQARTLTLGPTQEDQALGPTPEDETLALRPTPEDQAPENHDQAAGPASNDSGGPPAHSSGSSEGQHLSYLSVLEELTEVRAGQLGLELGLQGVAGRYGQDLADLRELLREEWRRSNQLQAQLNDLMDLQQNDVTNLRSDLASLEEKIAYQSYESSRDIWEVLESFQSKLQRLEQLQQVSQGEGLDSRSTRELLGKCMNLLLMVFAVVLMLMSTLSTLVLPFIRTRARTVTTCALALLLLWVWHNWDSFSLTPVSTLLPRWP